MQSYEYLTLIAMALLAGGLLWDVLRRNQPREWWSRIFSRRQYLRFRRTLLDYFEQQQVEAEVGDGIVIFPRDEDRTTYGQIGLLNVAQICRRAPVAQWNGIIGEFMTGLQTMRTMNQQLDKQEKNFDQVADLISLRLHPDSYIEDFGRHLLVYRDDLPGTRTVLVYDMPTWVRNVTPEIVEHWDRNNPQLFDAALERLRSHDPIEFKTERINDRFDVLIATGESHFVASHALLLDEYKQCRGTFGSLVAIPTRHSLLVHPINDASIFSSIHMLIAIVIGMERDGPGSITNRLYWYRNGYFHDLPYEIDPIRQSLRFMPPKSFVDVIDVLGGAQHR